MVLLKSGLLLLKIVHIVDLHSTMVLLKFVYLQLISHNLKYLHSTMVLLKSEISTTVQGATSKSTFHYGSIKIRIKFLYYFRL